MLTPTNGCWGGGGEVLPAHDCVISSAASRWGQYRRPC